jgi:hypothetical protein
MSTFQKMQAAIRKFLSLVIPPGVPEPRGNPHDPKAPPAPHFTFTTPADLTKDQSEKMADAIREELERQTGKKLIVMHLGSAPCNCPQCRMKAAAPWN